MGDIKICSLNCRGLGTFEKRRDVLNYLRKSQYNIFMLQDIHCSPEKENQFRNTWGGEVKMAGFSSNSRGVAILAKSIDIKYRDTRIDALGNYIIANVVINDLFEVILVNTYGPNTDEPLFFADIWRICRELRGDKDTPVIWGGDLNITLNFDIDALNYAQQNNKRATSEVQDIIVQNNLIDVYREINGERQKFTWKVGNPIRKQARLDYFLASQSLVSVISEANIIPGYRSDHSMVTMELSLTNQKRGKGFYKMNTSLLNDEKYVQIIENTIKDTISTYSLPIYSCSFVENCPLEVEVTISWSLFWETLILNMRTETISYSIHKRRKSMEEESNITREIERIENLPDHNMTEEIQSRLVVYREKLEELRKVKMEGIVTRSRTRWYEEGEKSTAYFMGLEKRNYVNKLIAALRDKNNEKKTKQTEIMEILFQHFSDLFAERPIDRIKAEEFVDGLEMKHLSEVQREEMDRPLTLPELTDALREMSNNKAPGTDGFPAEFFKAFWKDIKHFFFRMTTESYENGTLPKSLKEGIISLIPKPLKPRDEVKSYRPITLLNASYKIISSAVANRVKKALPDVVGNEQTGFIRNRFIGDNTRLTYDLIHLLNKTNRTALFLSLDIQDAFNSVNWEFIRIILRKLHFPQFCIQWFDTLCFEAASLIVYNGHISKRIRLER